MNYRTSFATRSSIGLIFLIISFSFAGCSTLFNQSNSGELIQQYRRNRDQRFIQLNNRSINYISIELCDSTNQEDDICYFLYRYEPETRPYIQTLSNNRQLKEKTMSADDYESYFAMTDRSKTMVQHVAQPVVLSAKYYKIHIQRDGKNEEYIIPFEQFPESTSSISTMVRKFIYNMSWSEMIIFPHYD
mgnify:CR=1 FL=1